MFSETGENMGNLLWRLALAEDDLGRSLPERSMMIDFGEAQVFERQVAQTFEGMVGGEATATNLTQQTAEGLGVHTICRGPGGQTTEFKTCDTTHCRGMPESEGMTDTSRLQTVNLQAWI